MTAVTAMKMPPTMAALVEVISGAPRHGETTLKPRPAPKASSSNVKAAATKAPAMMAGHETADVGATSFSTMTVSTMKFPLISMQRYSRRLVARSLDARPPGARVAKGVDPLQISWTESGQDDQASRAFRNAGAWRRASKT